MSTQHMLLRAVAVGDDCARSGAILMIRGADVLSYLPRRHTCRQMKIV
jgi:hypothetical protein